MLVFNNVTFKYPEDKHLIINNLSFEVEKGEFVSIIGASGCGKSTIFRIINGLESDIDGEVLINNIDIKKLNNYSAYMPQNNLLFPWRTIGENLSIPMEIKKINKLDIEKAIDKTLDEIGLLNYKNKYPRDLSGGMKQRVSFGRTLLTGSELLLLDEPFSALDSLTKMSMQEWLLDQYIHLNKTVLFITHDVEEAIFLSRYIYVVVDKPITHLEKIEVPIDYPRDRGMLKRNDIIELKENLINKLRQEVEI